MFFRIQLIFVIYIARKSKMRGITERIPDGLKVFLAMEVVTEIIEDFT